MGTLSIMHLLPLILLLPLLLLGVTPAPTQEEWPGQWYYLETLLQGGKVLTLMPDRQVRMHSKHHDQHQEWRLKTDGCLVNKAEPKLCLALEGNIEGSLLSMHEANGLESQKWKWKTNYLESYIRSNLFHYHLLLDVIWQDVPMPTGGASVHVWHNDHTDSQRWKMVPVL